MSAKIATNPAELPSGLAAALLASGGNVAKLRHAQYQRAKMRNLGPLWKNAQEQIDDAVVRVGEQGLVIAADRMAEFPKALPEWMSVLELTGHKVGEARKANRGMIPGSRPDGGGLQEKTPFTTPIYVTWDEFGFNARELAAAARAGRPLDTDEAEQSVRNVNYAIEDAIINGIGTINANAVLGMMDSTNTQTYETGTAWDDAGKTGPEIVTDVLAMADELLTDKFYGPKTLYVNTKYGAALQRNFDTTGGNGITIQAYLEQMQFGGRNLRVKTADLLTTDATLLVDDTASTCDVIVGQMPTAINPAPEIEFHTKWLVFACIVPRVKSNIEGNFGVCVGKKS